jgi:hypothetical protein
MAKFLFTMLPANDLGLPTRLLPIARVLADRGHEVAVFIPAPAPAKLIEETGLKNLPMPARDSPPMSGDFVQLSLAPETDPVSARQMSPTSDPFSGSAAMLPCRNGSARSVATSPWCGSILAIRGMPGCPRLSTRS